MVGRGVQPRAETLGALLQVLGTKKRWEKAREVIDE
jgi:hypothetical protein